MDSSRPSPPPGVTVSEGDGDAGAVPFAGGVGAALGVPTTLVGVEERVVNSVMVMRPPV